MILLKKFSKGVTVMDYEADLRQVHKKLENIKTALNESTIVAITNQRGVIEFVNKNFCDISKYKKEELIGKTHQVINSNYHSREFFKEMWRTIGTGNVWKGEIRNQAKDGSYYWVDTTIVPFLNTRGKPYQYIAIRHDITNRKQYEKMIKKMAFYDPLTSLPNLNFLGKWLQSHTRQEQTTVLYIDFNRFKSINDKYGHHIGDIILKKASQRLKQCLHKTDFISRLGWDEFIVILQGVSDKQEIISIVENITQQLSIPYDASGLYIHLSVSIGISMERWDKEKESDIHFIESLIRKADTAMKHAKRKDDNSYCFNTPDQNLKIDRYYQLEQEIETALEKNQFTVHYQPIIELKSEKMIGVEALLRWKNPKLGQVSPVEFIPRLEESGLIVPTGEWVLKTVCKQMKAWQDAGIFLKKACVNVSPIQFHHKDFTTCVKNIIEETQLDPAYLELEITEGTILNIDETHQVFKNLKESGISISIDDFGTGYSSLRYLKNLPINTLKMDKSFINDLDQDSKVIVDTMISMGKNLNFIVLAEGIEQKDQLDYLNRKGCHLGQGFYWSKPVKGQEIPALYKRFNNLRLFQ